MKVKVCGMKYTENIEAIRDCQPDLMGFIFYEKSPRFIENLDIKTIDFKEGIQKVGVFVNSTLATIKEAIQQYDLDYLQLHGDETTRFIQALKNEGLKIIKAFPISEEFDWQCLNEYAPYVDYFLFDTATKHYGGSGKKFDWQQLNHYTLKQPFFLSGGISIEDIATIQQLKMPQLYAIDVNSKFEIKPGLKDVDLIQKMIKQIKDAAKISSK